ncbi:MULTISPECIES: envelope stress response membrane protein PspC [Alteromonadaceae]|uniref:envelope stress response membrane protein PspC n=1 Tax=Alteromonadaceae TaxID=72275 RepID=UPI001C0849ED|nr:MULTISPECIES: envelope stress response membrane protein PspC [Aliiglaciecola]MBU2879844.1 envelope stress response membrane protein PspC [Aliiglaciecola lipolytica]MDO6709877.1 envelope stress response membrane protein PspC [Aliiglaciecola sp. 2_MG-2023]MDO6751025.1 envelope stress response membrane protein PspC [Aliiglaciecola sp. 1_MG-2023]
MTPRKQLQRDSENGKIAGVCAGIAEYFGIETWLVRIAAVAAMLLLAGPFIPVFYIAAWFILDKKTPESKHSSQGQHHFHGKSGVKGWHNDIDDADKKVAVKSKVWQAGEPPKQAFYDIKQQYLRTEARLRKIETYVTSSEFQLNREINKL